MAWQGIRKPRIIGAAVVVALLFGTLIVSADYTQRFFLTNFDPESNQGFPQSFAIEGDTIVAGAATKTTNGDNAGAIYIYKITPQGIISQQKIVPSRIDEGDQFGTSVDIDNGVIVVGARYAQASLGSGDTGVVFVYTPDGNGGYTEQVLLASDGNADDEFGSAVAIDDDRVVISATTFLNDRSNKLYVFEADAAGIFTEVAQITASDDDPTGVFGFRVALDDDLIVTSDYLDDDNGTSSGSVYIYTPDGNGGYDETKLTASDGAASDNFGFALDVAEDQIVVGARGANNYIGAVYLYSPSLISYAEEKYTPDGGQANDAYGIQVAIDNGVIVVGADGNDDVDTDAGAAFIITPGLLFDTVDTLTQPVGRANDEFGFPVAIDNGTVLVGARFVEGPTFNTGGIYVYNGDRHQLLENRGFEDEGSPDWTVKRATGDKVRCNKDKNGDGDTLDPEDKVFSLEGECAFRFKGGPGENSVIQQNLSPNWQQFSTGDTLSVSVAVDARPNVNGQIVVKVKYFDDTPTSKVKIPLIETENYDTFNESLTIASPNVNRIKFNIKHKSTAGRVFIDNASLRLNKASASLGYQPLPLPPAPVGEDAPEGFRG